MPGHAAHVHRRQLHAAPRVDHRRLGALALSRVLAAMLYGVSPRDPLLMAAVVLLLAGVALLAAWLPLRRALGTEPMVALRED